MEERVMWGPDKVWKTESAWWAWVRGGLRRSVWMKNPVKIDKLKASRYKAPLGKDGKEVWAMRCEMCEKEHRQSACQVDHKCGNMSLKCREDILPFVEHLAFITLEDLQILCKQCHDVKTYSERYGVTMEQARKRKEEIACKKKRKK